MASPPTLPLMHVSKLLINFLIHCFYVVKEVLNAVSIGVEAIAECEIRTVGTNFKALCGRIVEGVAIAHTEIIYFLFVFLYHSWRCLPVL